MRTTSTITHIHSFLLAGEASTMVQLGPQDPIPWPQWIFLALTYRTLVAND